MKVLLISSPQKNVVLQTAPSVISEEAGIYPPLGLLALATSIVATGKHEVKILDTIAEKFNYQQIRSYIEQEKPDIVGMTLITDYLRDSLLVAKIVKEIAPEIKIIVGGHHVNLFPIETIRLKEIDYAVIGDGDIVINEILDRINDHKQIDDIEGVITKNNYESANLKPILVKDLNKLPILKRELLDYKKYNSVLAKGSPVTTIMTSRGCPFNCPYCSGGGIPLRSLTPKRVVDEIESCINLGIYDILFFDELFTLNKKRVIEICDEIINRSLKIRWHARARIDTVDKEMLQKMHQAGCRLLQFGIETGSQKLQYILKRNFKLEKITEVIKMAKAEGILTYGNFMFNLPTETEDEMRQTIEFAIKLNLDYAVFGILAVFPKTKFYEEVISQRKIKEDFWQLFAENPLSYEIKEVFWPGNYAPEKLNEIVKKAYRKFYIRPRYILKAILRDESIHQKYQQIKSGINVIKRFFE